MTFQWEFPAVSHVFILRKTLLAPVLQGALYHLSLSQFRLQAQVLRLQLLLPKFGGPVLLLRGLGRRFSGFQLHLAPLRPLLGRLRQLVQVGHQLLQDHPVRFPAATKCAIGTEDAEKRQIHFRHQVLPGQGVVDAAEPHKPWRGKARIPFGVDLTCKVPYISLCQIEITMEIHGIPTSLSSSIFHLPEVRAISEPSGTASWVDQRVSLAPSAVPCLHVAPAAVQCARNCGQVSLGLCCQARQSKFITSKKVTRCQTARKLLAAHVKEVHF